MRVLFTHPADDIFQSAPGFFEEKLMADLVKNGERFWEVGRSLPSLADIHYSNPALSLKAGACQ
jgi:hypothetical protein